MEDLKKKINFDTALLYFSNANETKEEEQVKSSVVNMETYDRKHICSICGKRFFTKNALLLHITHHSFNDAVNIDKDKDDNNSDWKTRFILNKGISCNKAECNFVALDNVDYNKHLITCEGVRMSIKDNVAFCELCNSYFSCENYCKAHCTLQHPENSPDISLQQEDSKNTKISDPVCLYLQENKLHSINHFKNSSTHSMYPESFVSKKKLKETDLDVSLLHSSEEGTSKLINGNDFSITKIENNINKSVQINTKITENVQQSGFDPESDNCNEKLFSENNECNRNDVIESENKFSDINLSKFSQNCQESSEELLNQCGDENSAVVDENVGIENLVNKESDSINLLTLKSAKEDKIDEFKDVDKSVQFMDSSTALNNEDKCCKNWNEPEIKMQNSLLENLNNVRNEDRIHDELLNKVKTEASVVPFELSVSENTEQKSDFVKNKTNCSIELLKNNVQIISNFSTSSNGENVQNSSHLEENNFTENTNKTETKIVDTPPEILVSTNFQENNSSKNKFDYVNKNKDNFEKTEEIDSSSLTLNNENIKNETDNKHKINNIYKNLNIEETVNSNNENNFQTFNVNNTCKEENNDNDNNIETAEKCSSIISEEKYSEMEETMCNMFNDENRSQEKQTELKKDILEFKDPEETKSEDQFQFTKNEIVENMKNISSEDSEYSKLTTNDDLMKPKKEYHFQKKKYLKTYINMKKNEEKQEFNQKNSEIENLIEKVTLKPAALKMGSENQVRRRNRRKIIPEDLIIKQRSIRQRKKLILPDYEYGFDHKNEFNENDVKYEFLENSDMPYSSRGKSQKRISNRRYLKYDNFKTTDISLLEINKYVKNKTDDQEEEFSLNTTVMAESMISSSFNDLSRTEDESLGNTENREIVSLQEEEEELDDEDQQNDLDSWLKKVDFSEHSTLDSWCHESPKKKLGRPLKNKSTLSCSQKKMSNQINNIGSMSNIQKNRRNKKSENKKCILDETKHILDDTSECIETEISVIDDELDNEPLVNRKYVKKSKAPEISLNSNNVNPKKRGRPCKVKLINETSNINNQISTSIANAKNSFKNKEHNKKTSVEKYNADFLKQIAFLPQKKKGRPRKIKDVDLQNNSKNNPEMGHLPYNIFEKSIPRKNSDFIKEFARLSSSNQNKKFKSDEERQTPLLVNKNMKKKRSKKIETIIQIKRHLQLMKMKKRYKELNDMKVLEKKNKLMKVKFDHCDHSNNAKQVHIDRIISGEINKSPGIVLDVMREKEKEKNDAEKRNCAIRNIKDKTIETTISVVEQKSSLNLDEKKEILEEAVGKTEDIKITVPVKKGRKIVEKIPKVNEDDLPPDETIKIDEALYLADVRARTRYSKVFKKQQIDPKNEELFSNKLVTCGRCHKKMTLRHYMRNHQISHYYLCWLEDEREINLNDDSEVIKILQSAINPESLRKKAIRLSCELCSKTMKSVIGYVSHVRFCTKKGLLSDETELFEKCILCGKTLKPSSIRHHYVKFHGVSKFVVSDEGKITPDLNDSTKIRRNAIIMPLPPKKNYLMGFERVAVEKSDILNDQDFWISLKTSYDLYMCMGLSCRHMTLSKDDLKTHILNCGANFCEFSCSSCPYKTKYESEIIYHSKKNCKETSDVEDSVEENVEEKIVESNDRRISTRVKKRKYMFDFDDEDDQKKTKIKTGKRTDDDADFEVKFESDNDVEEDNEPVEKKSRSSKKKLDDSSSKISDEGGLRQAFIQHCSLKTSDPLNWTVDMRLKTFSTSPVHMNLKVDINEWETFPISGLPKYSPVQQNSMKISFDNQSFIDYKLFQSDVIKGVPVCYTGGPVWSMAWTPLPAYITEQYLAIGGLPHMNYLVEVNTPVKFPSLIQIWKFSSLDNISNDIHKPTLAWAIAHEFGAVWSMEWCPSGGFDNTSTPYRLGILALATSAGCAVIYSVPRLDCGGETRSIVANPEPDLILKIRCDTVQCTRIAWQRNYSHSIVFGGFSNGTVALWNICTSSFILKKGKIVYPHRTFEAYNTAITVLDVHWLDNSRFLLTGSLDRIMKFWDLEDLSGPMYEIEKSNLTLSAIWMHHWIVTANGNDIFSPTDMCACLIHPRDLMERKKSLSSLRDSFWSMAYSDWNDTVALSTNGGNISVFAAKHLSAITYRVPDFEKIITETKLLPLGDDQKNDSKNVEENTCSLENYGLQFCDRVKPKSSMDDLNFSVEQSNVKSVNKVCWNQNYNSFNWLAVGYECGFVRVIRVERFDKHHLTKFYKMNENNTITLI